MGPKGRLCHGEVINHDQRVHQPLQLAVDEAEGLKACAPGRLLTLLRPDDCGFVCVALNCVLSGHMRLLS